MDKARNKATWKLAALAIGVCMAATAPSASALSGNVATPDGTPIPYTFIGLLDANFQFIGMAVSDLSGAFAIDVAATTGFLYVQPYAPVNSSGLGIYPYEPRMYAINGESYADLRLPNTGCIVLKAYDQAGNLMRWQDFLSRGTQGGQFMYATNTDDESRPAACWPVYDELARLYGSPKEYGLPSLVVPTGENRVVNVMFWEVPGYGKLALKADNAGKGYTVTGGAIELELNVALAETAVADLQRRSDVFGSAAASSIAALDAALASARAQSSPAARAAQADQVLAAALELRDNLELQAAQEAIPSVRKGNLTVTVKNRWNRPISNCTVSIKQKDHAFKFGAFDGDQYDEAKYEAVRDAGFEMATLLVGWAWTETAPGTLLDPGIIDAYYGISALKDMGFDLKVHGATWMQNGMIPARAYSMPYSDVAVEALDHQQNLLSAFAPQFDLWEAVNEPAATNVVGMPREAMDNLVALAANNIKALGGIPALVNSPPEIDYGRKYLYYGLDNQPLDQFTVTYSEFLKQAETTGCLDDVDVVGIQFYPGYKLNADFNYLEGPAMTPAWFVDTVNRYADFGRPIHITEFSLPSIQAADWNNGYWREPWNEELQADYAEAIFTLAFANPSIESLTWWDIDDTNAAVLCGGLIDAYGRQKPVYSRIKDLIASWTTEESGKTNSRGQTSFSGFAGAYEVTITTWYGKSTTREVVIDEQGSASLSVKL